MADFRIPRDCASAPSWGMQSAGAALAAQAQALDQRLVAIEIGPP